MQIRKLSRNPIQAAVASLHAALHLPNNHRPEWKAATQVSTHEIKQLGLEGDHISRLLSGVIGPGRHSLLFVCVSGQRGQIFLSLDFSFACYCFFLQEKNKLLEMSKKIIAPTYEFPTMMSADE